MDAADFRVGLYQHYKGGLYTVLGIVLHHQTHLPMVRCWSHSHQSENVRPLVGWPGDPDGWEDRVEVNGESVPRFYYIDGERASRCVSTIPPHTD